jgi:hypothetical protein
LVKKERRESPEARVRALFLIVLTVCCVAVFTARADDATDIKAKLDVIRKAGEPTTVGELDKWYPRPAAGENAADILTNAFAKLQTGNLSQSPTLPVLGNGNLPAPVTPLPPAMKTSIAAVVANNREALELLHQSVKIKQCRYPVDLRKGFDTKLPHLAGVKRSALLLELAAVWAAEEGQTGKAADSIGDILQLAASLKNEPFLISQLVRIACNSVALTTLERVLNRSPLPEEQLHMLAIAFKAAEDLQAFRHALIGERVNGIIIFQMSVSQRKTSVGKIVDDADPSHPLPQRIWARENWDGDYNFYLTTMDEIISGLAKGDKALSQLESRFAGSPDYQRIVSGLILPTVPRGAIRELDSIARMRMGQTAIALERYRRAHQNQLPARLDDLVPEYLEGVPKDTHGDGSLVFSIQPGGGYTISSRGMAANKPIAISVK